MSVLNSMISKLLEIRGLVREIDIFLEGGSHKPVIGVLTHNDNLILQFEERLSSQVLTTTGGIRPPLVSICRIQKSGGQLFLDMECQFIIEFFLLALNPEMDE